MQQNKSKLYLAAALGTTLATAALVVSSVYAAPQHLLDTLNLSEEDAAILDEAHELRQQGDHEGAQELLESLSIDHESLRGAMHEQKDAMHEAIENNDYQAFQAASDGTQRESITEEQFSVLVKVHELHEEARQLLEDAGLEQFGKGEGPHAMMKHRFHGANEAE